MAPSEIPKSVPPCVLISGASSGIGFETARIYSANGYEVWLLGRSQKKLELAAKELKGVTQVFPCDLSDLRQVEQVGLNILSTMQGKPLKCLIHNAGFIKRAAFTESTPHEWEESFHVHVLGPVILTQKLLSLMYSVAPAYIVNVSSNLGIHPIAQTSSYSASKAAMLNWTRSLALELAPQKIHVNAIAPGIVETPIHGQWNDQMKNHMDQLQPLERVGKASEIARSIYFLGSEQSSWTTGSVLTVDGGISLL
ncbi:MAG: SDR family oxidoreductase [Bdellovibrionales bacterium]|nr:SDR family oxidoreductase [Bdellovibrionales bacterium]